MQKITPCLWFNDQALEAAKFYCSIFKNSKLGKITYYGEGMPKPKGTILTVSFRINGQNFLALNGGPEFNFTEAISLIVNCKTQKEVDRMWKKLSEGGQEVQCGWLKDKYGVSWQVTPTALMKMMNGRNPEGYERMMQELMQMKKLDIKALKKAYGSAKKEKKKSKERETAMA
jgi:predicted 3-demethylubiquinone-9 3-methyltransferase (glyoxalase superfamily)